MAVCVIAAAVRISAARGELWLDEALTLQLLREQVHQPADIFLSLKHDNNHFLNSLIVYLAGPDGSAWTYRWPAILAGTLTVVMAGWILRRHGPASVLAAVLLSGFSFLLVNYSSEARGYAYEICLALIAFGILCEADVSRALGWDVLFTIVCVLGFLAHATFVMVYLAAQVWTWFPWRRDNHRSFVPTILLRTVVPGVFIAWLYLVNLGQMHVAGGNDQPYGEVIVQTLSMIVGGPFAGMGAYAAAIVSVLLTTAALWSAFRRSAKRGSFYLCAIVLLPAMLLAAVPREDIYPRYFLTSVLFMLLAWSEFVGEVAARCASSKWWLPLALGAYVAANGWHIAQLVSLGRGHYQEVIQMMEQETQGTNVRIVVDQRLRQGLMLNYYGRRLHLDKPIQIADPSAEAIAQAQWVLLQDANVNVEPAARITPFGVPFQLVQDYAFAGLSGWHLFVYRRTQPSAGSAQ